MKNKSAPRPYATPANGLLSGQFFHSISKEKGTVEWQGYVVGSPEPGWYYVQLYEWLMGETSSRHLVRFEDMAKWIFYPNSESMNHSYDYGVARKFRARVDNPTAPDQSTAKPPVEL